MTIFERKSKLGGMMRYGIPSFRLPLDILNRYQKKLVELGIHIRPNTSIGGILTLDTLFADGYDAVFIGSGVWRPRGLGVRGESLGNCHYAVDYLQNPDVYQLGDRVAVIGSGNSAMDAARTAIRKGSRFVTVYARRNEVRASIREYEYAQADGVEFDLCKGVAAITKDGPLLYERHFDADGNLLSEDEPQLYPADSMMTLLPSTGDGSVTQKYFHLPDYATAPIQQGDVVGTVELKLAGETIGVVNLIAGQDVHQNALLFTVSKVQAFFHSLYLKVVIVLSLLTLAVYGLWVFINLWNGRRPNRKIHRR